MTEAGSYSDLAPEDANALVSAFHQERVRFCLLGCCKPSRSFFQRPLSHVKYMLWLEFGLAPADQLQGITR